MNTIIQDTPKEKIYQIFRQQSGYAPSLKTSSAKQRIAKLDSIYNFLTQEENSQKLFASLKEDLRKNELEALTSEISVILTTIKDIKNKLRTWMSDKRVTTPLSLTGAKSYIHYEPKGVALIISPWNYPFQLAINPLLYAIAAGCTAILKPSEYSGATSTFIATMVAELFDEKEVAVCQGGIPTSETLLALPFNHMYFTGSPTVGKIVMKAASQHLSSVTLELGGKSPCIVDDMNIDQAAKKIVWGKFFNTGQTCIAPDYVLVHEKDKLELLKAIEKQISIMYDPESRGIKQNKDYGRLISEKHFDSVTDLLDDAIKHDATLVCGGESDRNDKYLAPTVVTNVDVKSDLMQTEIFGPVLPVLTYKTLDEALQIVGNLPKPLAFYILSNNKKNITYILNNSTAGGTVINDFLLHFANHNLPFGGVNNSGIGKSHGKHGFVAFSNERAVMHNKFSPTNLLHPPYGSLGKKMAKLMGRWI